MVPYDGGVYWGIPALDAETHNDKDEQAPPPWKVPFLRGIGWYTKPPNVRRQTQMGAQCKEGGVKDNDIELAYAN